MKTKTAAAKLLFIFGLFILHYFFGKLPFFCFRAAIFHFYAAAQPPQQQQHRQPDKQVGFVPLCKLTDILLSGI